MTRIAIVGAGIGGLSAAISLRRLSNVDVQIFEQAEALREVGASIALGPNGLRGLEEMGATNALSEEIAFRSDHGYPMVYRHWKTGEELVKDEHSPSVTQWLHHTARYYRPHLQQALADNIPRDTIHLNKRLIDVTVKSDDGVLLEFEDGSQHHTDLVIGADGISSKVRSAFLADYKLESTGQIALRAVFDVSCIQDLIAENPELRNSVHVTGPDKNFFSSMLGKGKFTVVGLGFVDDENSPWRGKKWDEEADLQRFQEAYKDWHPSVSTLVDRVPPDSIRVYPGSASNQIPPPVHAGRIALVGDSFHPHGGAFAAGGSLAIDDSIALFLSLQHIQQLESTASASQTKLGKLSPANLSRALDLYAATRLPHVRKVFDAVERLRAGAQAAKADRYWDEEKIRVWAKNKKEVVWLHEHDVHRAFADVINVNS
ncbi:FAD/NAD-P-binding domain-containing protein [Gymnopus androsaceus JB14]|uniref:FAD/NAD-P-binding domain-containing protein n=1 Tax=Gymnopus androsaceus JB14 TaxID=1447944 RepID=A0A6A4IF93_9AGAR|nr:FAD/NAD-P-binding domain-containing protein [Gymnopus androsaceus JB14]